MMRVIIAGSRTITGNLLVHEAIEESGFKLDITEVVCGGAEGVDLLGDEWAYHRDMPVEYFLVTRRGRYDYNALLNLRPAVPPFENVRVISDWYVQGRPAGPIRNAAMADYADALIAIHDTSSAGTGTPGMIRLAKARGLRVFIKSYTRPLVMPAPAPQECAE